jgi:hypothetical protein
VYRVGHRAPSLDARYLGAVLAGGDEAVLSGHAAAYEFRLIRGEPPPPEVSAPRDRRIAGVSPDGSAASTLGTAPSITRSR